MRTAGPCTAIAASRSPSGEMIGTATQRTPSIASWSSMLYPRRRITFSSLVSAVTEVIVFLVSRGSGMSRSATSSSMDRAPWDSVALPMLVAWTGSLLPGAWEISQQLLGLDADDHHHLPAVPYAQVDRFARLVAEPLDHRLRAVEAESAVGRMAEQYRGASERVPLAGYVLTQIAVVDECAHDSVHGADTQRQVSRDVRDAEIALALAEQVENGEGAADRLCPHGRRRRRAHHQRAPPCSGRHLRQIRSPCVSVHLGSPAMQDADQRVPDRVACMP